MISSRVCRCGSVEGPFDDVTTTFSAGAVRLTGRTRRQVDLHEAARDEQPPQRGRGPPDKVGVLRQDQFAFDQFRVLDAVIMAITPLERAPGARELYARTDMTDAEACASATRRHRR